jgi:hypothetical protein
MVEKANLFDKSNILKLTANGFRYQGKGFVAITRGAMFAVLEKNAGANSYVIREQLIRALVEVFAVSTAMNYASRCLTVAQYWRWHIDESKSFVANADEIAGAVERLWQEVNNIRKSGPPASRV